jgi:hypothetical protein
MPKDASELGERTIDRTAGRNSEARIARITHKSDVSKSMLRYVRFGGTPCLRKVGTMVSLAMNSRCKLMRESLAPPSKRWPDQPR